MQEIPKVVPTLTLYVWAHIAVTSCGFPVLDLQAADDAYFDGIDR